MKLNRVDNREPQPIRVALPAAIHDKLQAYLEYANSNGTGQGFMELKQLVIEICRAFVERGDKDFAQWLRTKTQPAVAVQQRVVVRKEKQSRRENGGPMPVEDSTVPRD